VTSAAARITAACAGRRVTLMEVCGTHTVALFRTGVRSQLPAALRLISGPGCPVCVTAQGYIDAALDLALRPGVTIATYGDMVRVPGRGGSLAEARARGADILVVYSARDAVAWAAAHPARTVVFLAVGFETTTPATAQAVLEAEAQAVGNFLVLTAHKVVVPAMLALLAGDGGNGLDGFLCPGHVSVVIGSDAYRPIVERHGKGCVVAGFEAASMLEGVARLCEMARDGAPDLDNSYTVAVKPGGNPHAQALLARVFEPCDATWRAMGTIPGSGLRLRPAYRRFDAAERFQLDTNRDDEIEGCRCGEVIQGKTQPSECPRFGVSCTPSNPIGPCMVSSEGTCAAWFNYGR
jgi:hydrogenase expression/formation protein HypD